MGLLNTIIQFIAKASIPTFKFENNSLFFKLKNDDFYEYELDDYEIKTRHDPYVLEAYTLQTSTLFLEAIRTDSNTSWNGQALSLYEGFFKEKLHLRMMETIEKKEIGNYTFKVYKLDESFIVHMIYISFGMNEILILDTQGELYKNVLFRLDGKYIYKFQKEEKGNVNFNISLVKENCLRGFFNASND